MKEDTGGKNLHKGKWGGGKVVVGQTEKKRFKRAGILVGGLECYLGRRRGLRRRLGRQRGIGWIKGIDRLIQEATIGLVILTKLILSK